MKLIDEYTKPKGKTLEQRKNSFIKDCSLQTMEYGTEMIMDFIGYWTEHSPTAKKMRFEKEKAFDISRRLKTWARNAQRFGGDRGTGINLEDW